MFKLGFFIVFLLLFQSIEAKREKQPTNIQATISTYVADIQEFLQDAWDALLDLLPFRPGSSSTKIKKIKKKNKNNYWDINYYVKSVSKNLNYLYESVRKSTMETLDLDKRSKQDEKVEHVFSMEIIAAEMLEKITWGFLKMFNNFERTK